VAGAVITRQRPGTAKGFVFLSLEDETGIANIIVNPDVFASFKRTIVEAPYLLVEGVLQNQDGAVSVKADRVEALEYAGPEFESHDFPRCTRLSHVSSHLPHCRHFVGPHPFAPISG
jgi:error-prone DNA polymerase